MIYTADKKTGVFGVYLVKIDSMLFLDGVPNDPNINSSESLATIMLLPTHGFMKVEQIQPTLKMRSMDNDGLKKGLEKEPNLLKHEIVDDRVVLTASTQELQDFMRKHANDPNVFSEASNMQRVKICEPNQPKTKNDTTDDEKTY